MLPSVGISDGERNREMDVVVAHPRDGVAVIEVKGHRPTVREGLWYAHGRPMEPQPHEQASDNAYALRTKIRDFHPALRGVQVAYAVAFPNVASIDGRLPTDVDRTEVFTAAELDDCLDAVERLVFRRSGNRARRVRTPEADRAPPSQLRVHLRAGGTGAPRAASSTTSVPARSRPSSRSTSTGRSASPAPPVLARPASPRRGLVAPFCRDERVLLTCFNRPLAESLRSRLGESEQHRIGAFHEIALDLDGMPPLDVPDTADRRVLGRGRDRTPPRPLARDHRPVRHDRRRRGTGLPSELD